jgi:ribose 5-phosphate isomerase B
MKIIIGSDHAGYDLKELCKAHLLQTGEHQVKDVGVFSRDSSDYPKIAKQVAAAVSRREYDRGLLICGSGIGMSITANRFRGRQGSLVSGSLFREDEQAPQRRKHFGHGRQSRGPGHCPGDP